MPGSAPAKEIYMPDATLSETIFALEQQMWAAFACGDSQAFSALVDPRALMITGGGRTSGAFYAQAIAMLHLERFELRDWMVLALGAEAAAIHYTAEVAGGPGAEDLSGVYRVSSVWQRQAGGWRLVLNHDSALVNYPG